MIRKADIILIVIIIALSCITTFFILKNNDNYGKTFEVYVDNKLYGSYNLSEFQEIKIEEDGKSNTVKVDKNGVKMIKSNCKNKNCVHQGYIYKVESNIVCIPNRILIKIKGENGDIDSVSK